jgi:HEPN domain-containing protein
MKKETKQWLDYADENFRSAIILRESHLYNPSLQNAQQAIEKSLKALIIEKGLKFQKTHSVSTIVAYLERHDVPIRISEDALELIDSIYLSSKYPLGSVLPDFDPTEEICRLCIEIASDIRSEVLKHLANASRS